MTGYPLLYCSFQTDNNKENRADYFVKPSQSMYLLLPRWDTKCNMCKSYDTAKTTLKTLILLTKAN